MMGVSAIPQAYLEDRFIRYSDVRRIIGVRVSNGLRANQTVMWTDLATASDARRDLSSLVDGHARHHRARRHHQLLRRALAPRRPRGRARHALPHRRRETTA
jgi:hypothetical protein